MMLSKIQRAKVQRAHDLALYGRVDIAITWYTGPDPETTQRKVMATPEQAEVMKRAVSSAPSFNPPSTSPISLNPHCLFPSPSPLLFHLSRLTLPQWDTNFGTLDGDRMHCKPRPKSSPSKKPTSPTFDDINRDPRWATHEENLPEPECQGGFYACVHVDQLPALVALQQWPWKVAVTTLITPQRMSIEQQEEMQGYHEERKKVKEAAIEKKTEEWERVHRMEMERQAEKGHFERRNHTYERAMGRSREMKRCLDVPVNHYKGEEGKDGSETMEYGQGTSSFMRLT